MQHEDREKVYEEKPVGNRHSIGEYASIHEHPENGLAPKPNMYSFNSSQQHPHHFAAQVPQPMAPPQSSSPFQAPFTPIHHAHTPLNSKMVEVSHQHGSREALHPPPEEQIYEEHYIDF